MTVTKQKLIESIQNQTDFSKKQSAELVESVMEYIAGSLEKGEDVLISGFGKFQVKEKKARNGRNPATREPMNISARKVVTFKLSGNLKDKINGKD
jgi:integration host factor subunit alpha